MCAGRVCKLGFLVVVESAVVLCALSVRVQPTRAGVVVVVVVVGGGGGGWVGVWVVVVGCGGGAPPCFSVATRACWLCSCVIACWLVVLVARGCVV